MDYLKALNPKETNPALVSLRTFALKNNVPIITEEGLAFLLQIITLKKCRNILEIGTAIGYSALAIAAIDSGIKVTTIERDLTMQNQATEHFKLYDIKEQITLIKGDALEIDESMLNGPYDLIFIDGAKAQSIKFFERYEPLLDAKGVVVTDNLLFKGLVSKYHDVESKNLKALLKKIDAFNHYVINKDGYHSYIYPIGDGMSVSIKKD